jgi:hypothetical protein
MLFYFTSLFNTWLFTNTDSKTDNNTSRNFIDDFFEELGEWIYGKCQILAKKYLFEQMKILLKQTAVLKYISNSETPAVVFRSS